MLCPVPWGDERRSADMRKPRDQSTATPAAYGCLAAAVLLIVVFASFAVVFLWNVNALP